MVEPEEQSHQPDAERPALRRLRVTYERIDDAIFGVEALIVSVSTVLMTLFIFLDLSYSFVNGIKIRLFATASGKAVGLTTGKWVALGLSVALVIGLVIASVRASPRLADKSAARRGAAILFGTALAGAFIVALVSVQPRYLMLALTVATAAFTVRGLLAARARDELRPIAVVAALTIFVPMFQFAATVPDRYSSWTQPYALFLLLWVGFIGASMATSRGRHLKIDAIRKALPERLLPRYNAVSYLVASAFTGVFCYLAVRYTIARFSGEHTAGEIPDWLKVLAIPVSLGFITIRFGVRSMLAAMGHREDLGGEGAGMLSAPAGEGAE